MFNDFHSPPRLVCKTLWVIADVIGRVRGLRVALLIRRLLAG